VDIRGALAVTIDVARAEAFLAAHFGSDAGDVTRLGLGVWSQAFAFRRAGQDYVVRFGAHQEDFAKDRLAARYASPALPIPRVVEIGRAFGGYCAISERLFGAYIQAYQAYTGDWANLKATARHTLDVATGIGWG
jgi:hypothetical protein